MSADAGAAMEKIRSVGLPRTQGLIAGKWVARVSWPLNCGNFFLAVEEPLKTTFQNVHQGNLRGILVRFLKAREWSAPKAHKMLMDCLNWRVQNEIDSVLAKPILPSDLYRAIRDTLLVGLTGYSKQGQPVYAFGVGLSTFDQCF
ncbi:uncharacterized protein [Miscanthus floridulus]|uniref:uncharacterized protein n=1 Tax=Miscanthus floridulus TaxID=154761 RepID=UPI00345A868C